MSVTRPFSARLVLGAVAVSVAFHGFAAAGGTSDQKPRFEGLKPGEFVTRDLDVPVRIVLIGFERNAIDTDVLRSWLPAAYRPLVRYPRFYGLNGRDLGLEYSFRYKIVSKGEGFERRFFEHLARIGVEGPRTLYQTAYNDQASNLVDVADRVLYIDGPSIEDWLDKNDPKDGYRYTIYFINWYGRDDFRFHVYTKTDDPDPDTGLNFGQVYSSRKVVGWGGTHGRSWFYDFSAGPEANVTNFIVDAKDLDGDGVEDYRMPVIWEYDAHGYRSPAFLSDDMGLLARFVAIDLLFTPSPLYDPLVTAPQPLGRKIAHVSMLEEIADPGEKGVGFFRPAFALSKLQAFQPYYRWKVDLDGVDPIDDGAKRALDDFTLRTPGAPDPNGCWVPFGTPFAALFCYFDANRSSYVPAYRPRDYVAPVFSFNTDDLGVQNGLLGFADDNWVDGTQSYVFTFSGPFYRSLGYGFTGTTVHELGHHIGLSHPHDGYDPAYDIDYGPGNFFYFAWAGDESDTVMHYLSLSNGFGAHNQDNMYRWEAAGYLNYANALAADLLASPKSWRVQAALHVADGLAARAAGALEGWRYLESASAARQAYSVLAAAADEIGVTSSRLAAAQRLLPNATVPKEGCRPRIFEDQQPPK